MNIYKTPGVFIEERTANGYSASGPQQTFDANIILSLSAGYGYDAVNQTWQDKSANNNLVTLSAGSNLTADGIYFDGLTKGAVRMPFTLSSDYSVYFTVKPEIMDRTILGNNAGNTYGLYYVNPGFYTAPGSLYNIVNVSATVHPFYVGNTYAVAMVRTIGNGLCKLYINDNYIDTFGGINQAPFPILQIGGENGFFFKGWMKNMVIYTVAHDAEQVSSVMSRLR